MTEGQSRLESARSAVATMYRDTTTPALEIVENLELLIEDCEMYADRITAKLEADQYESDGVLEDAADADREFEAAMEYPREYDE